MEPHPTCGEATSGEMPFREASKAAMDALAIAIICRHLPYELDSDCFRKRVGADRQCRWTKRQYRL